MYSQAIGGKNWNSKELHSNGKLKLDFNFINDNQDGLCRSWNADGMLIDETNWKNAEQHGISKAWYENGQLKWIENYQSGKIHGKCESWYSSGKIRSKGNLKKGSGSLNYYLEDGTFQGSAIFKNGIVVN